MEIPRSSSTLGDESGIKTESSFVEAHRATFHAEPNEKSASADDKSALLPTGTDDGKISKLAPSICTTGSDRASSKLSLSDTAIGRPCRRRKFKILDSIAVSCSLICLILGVITILPSLSVSWRLGFQAQIIVIGFLIGVMNICAERVVPSCFIAVEARFGSSRLQNYDAILANKFLTPHISLHWRLAMIIFLALPLALSVGYKQFLGGVTSVSMDPLLGLYGLSYPIIGSWKPVSDPIYLQVSSNAAFSSESAKASQILNGSNHYPLASGYNLLLLSENSAALLDLPTNSYLDQMRAQFEDGESWQVSASVNAYLATLNNSADLLRSDDSYWAAALNASAQGLASYWLAQTEFGYIGMLPIVEQPYCWIGMFDGGPTSEGIYSKNLSSLNVQGFRKSAQLFDLRRQRCQATWNIDATSMRLISGICDLDSPKIEEIDQSAVAGPASGVFAVSGGPNLPHIFWEFSIQRPNSSWLMPTYAVTTATTYWARGAYMMEVNGFSGYNYTAINEQVLSSRSTLRATPLLFLCLAIQPLLTIVALLVTSQLSLPISGDFGLISVLAGMRRSTLDLLGGAGFSGELKRPVRLEILLSDARTEEVSGLTFAEVTYQLKPVHKAKSKVAKADGKTIYM